MICSFPTLSKLRIGKREFSVSLENEENTNTDDCFNPFCPLSSLSLSFRENRAFVTYSRLRLISICLQQPTHVGLKKTMSLDRLTHVKHLLDRREETRLSPAIKKRVIFLQQEFPFQRELLDSLSLSLSHSLETNANDRFRRMIRRKGILFSKNNRKPGELSN